MTWRTRKRFSVTETLALSFKDAEGSAPTAKSGLKLTLAGEVLQVGLARPGPGYASLKRTEQIGQIEPAGRFLILLVDSPLNGKARSRSS
jgi:hypothetical protein